MVKLLIPYRSQWDNDAETHNADCGPTCLAMILNYKQVAVTPDGLYKHLPPKEPSEFTTFTELKKAAQVFNVQMTYRSYEDQTNASNNLRSNLDAGNPFIVLIKYASWQELTGNPYEWGHFVVVTGYDNGRITFHDPLFGLWQLRSKGVHFAMSEADFCLGWGGFPSGENPNWACSVAETAVDHQKPPTPSPVPAAPENIMDDVNLRIRALAAYRWAAAPDVNNPAELQLWQENLGDWGLVYDNYIVQAGDTLAGVSGRFYGQQHRWHAIQIYNELHRDGLWLGETLRIPQMGQDGAHLNLALPSDTTDFAKALDLGMLIDPDLPAQDYNALGSKSLGIGF